MSALPVAHVLAGPLDAVIELGLPLIIFVALYWWSSRKERAKRGEDPPARSPRPQDEGEDG